MNKNNMHEEILSILREHGVPLNKKQLTLFVPQATKKKRLFTEALSELLQSGTLNKIKENYILAGPKIVLTGILQMQRSGIGFVLSGIETKPDILIYPENLGEAWNGDLVEVNLINGRFKGKNPIGKIIKVLEHKPRSITAKVLEIRKARSILCQGTNPRMPIFMRVIVPIQNEIPDINDIIQVLPKREGPHWNADFICILGAEFSLQTQENIVKTNHAIPSDFPPNVLKEVAKITEISNKSHANLTKLGFVTIDGENARDFDDAIYVEKHNKNYILYVAIADVSSYVLPNSPLDIEALERGTSYYFPLSVEPMLPERLSNDLCSLIPLTDRATVVAELSFNENGDPIKTAFYTAIINSKARLTYTQVQLAIFEKDEKQLETLGQNAQMLKIASQLFQMRAKKRTDKGALALNIPEAAIAYEKELDIVSLTSKYQNDAQKLIEEFMISANEAVAIFLTENKKPCLYRVHPAPNEEKLEALYTLLYKTPLANKLNNLNQPLTPQLILEFAKGTEQEMLVSSMLLRSMMQAQYTLENVGHFGLASECYCHFTSPIRRYADIMIHRALKSIIEKKTFSFSLEKISDIAKTINQAGRTALEAEREMIKRAAILALQGHEGQIFQAIISSFSDFGFWITLKHDGVTEGLIPFSSMKDDRYVFWSKEGKVIGERTGQIFTLGQSIEVRLEINNLDRLEMVFSFSNSPKSKTVSPNQKFSKIKTERQNNKLSHKFKKRK